MWFRRKEPEWHHIHEWTMTVIDSLGNSYPQCQCGEVDTDRPFLDAVRDSAIRSAIRAREEARKEMQDKFDNSFRTAIHHSDD